MTFEGRKFVVTGLSETTMTRREIVDFIEARGGKVTSTVSKKTDYVVLMGDPSPQWITADGGTKITKARELNTPIIQQSHLVCH